MKRNFVEQSLLQTGFFRILFFGIILTDFESIHFEVFIKYLRPALRRNALTGDNKQAKILPKLFNPTFSFDIK